MQGKIKKAFPGGNTCYGSYSFFDNIIPENIKRIFCLKGGPGVGKSSLMKSIARHFNDIGYDVELFNCPSDPSSLDALVIKEIGVVLLDGTAPHIVDPKLPGAKDEIINLGVLLNTVKMEENREEIEKVDYQISAYFKRAYKYLAAAQKVYQDIEEKNSHALKLDELNSMTESFICDIFKDIQNVGKYHKVVDLFASAVTPVGYLDHTKYVIPEGTKTFFLDGRIGTGKSDFMKKIVTIANLKGLKVEAYHFPLIPEKLETVYLPELEIAFSTSILFGDSNKIDFDKFLDIEKLAVFEEALQTDEKILDTLIKEAISSLESAKSTHDVLEKYYVPNMDFAKVDEVKEDLIERIKYYI
ncbi:MAG: ATP-binding protein [Clostridioides sp.]|jgi:hypothetical protein|nr:ATP-binding protein [Clostridioides sp.]